jgi:hypothetical protein
VTGTQWGEVSVVRYDNATNTAITHNPPDAAWNPNTYGKVVWTEPSGGTFYVCTVDFGLTTAVEAELSAKVADSTHPESSGCGGFPWTRYFTPFELEGRWATDYGMTDEVSSLAWNAQAIVSFDNAANVAITQNPADDPWGPSKFSKVVWTEPTDGAFYYCIVDFGLATAAEAEASTKNADDTSPQTSGCGSFPWTRNVPALELHGAWSSAYGDEDIDSFTWASSYLSASVVSYDNARNVAVTQNAADDAYFPSKFNRVVWTEPKDGSFFYCVADYGLDSAALALGSSAEADAGDPAVGGCGGFPWTQLSAR